MIAKEQARDWRSMDALASGSMDSITPNVQSAPPPGVAAIDYPIVISGTGALEGKKVTLISGGRIACADGTLAEWLGRGAPYLIDPNHAFQGKKILELTDSMVLFQDPDPQQSAAGGAAKNLETGSTTSSATP
jgi:fructose-specific component phosphotransferase system IIB-like protein